VGPIRIVIASIGCGQAFGSRQVVKNLQCQEFITKPTAKTLRIGDLLTFWIGTCQTRPDLIKSAIDRLRPEFQLIQSFSSVMQCAGQELPRLTDEQMRILDLLRDTKRLVVKGCAGSGKTLLA
jgi:predicted ribonuclease YlaK